jgi:hypothetical protein
MLSPNFSKVCVMYLHRVRGALSFYQCYATLRPFTRSVIRHWLEIAVPGSSIPLSDHLRSRIAQVQQDPDTDYDSG